MRSMIYVLIHNLDAVVQKSRKWNEHCAFCDMVDRYDSAIPTVFIADRGYESYNNMAHVQLKGQFFLFRIKDFNSHGILQGFDLADKDIFDFPISLSLTRKQNNATNMDNQIIKIIELIYNPV